MNKKIIEKIDNYVQWDFGITLDELKEEIKNNEAIRVVNYILISISMIILLGVLTLALFLLTLGHPLLVFILLYIDLLLVVYAYYVYSDKIKMGYILKNIKKYVNIKFRKS